MHHSGLLWRLTYYTIFRLRNNTTLKLISCFTSAVLKPEHVSENLQVANIFRDLKILTFWFCSIDTNNVCLQSVQDSNGRCDLFVVLHIKDKLPVYLLVDKPTNNQYLYKIPNTHQIKEPPAKVSLNCKRLFFTMINSRKNYPVNYELHRHLLIVVSVFVFLITQ